MKQEIRLLTLFPGRFGSSIAISLEITPLAQLGELKFEALSYTWGSITTPLEIKVKTQNRNIGSSGKPRLASLSVTENLHEALEHLRSKHESRLLWIDATCVNQQDLKERGSQVQRMPDIYGSADSVLIWLGPDSDSSRDVMRYCNELGSQIARDTHGLGWDTIKAATPHDMDLYSEAFRTRMMPDIELWSSICELLSRPWFGRLWIWQEVILASNKIVLSCGSMSSDFYHLCTSITWLSDHKPDLFPDLPNLAWSLASMASNPDPESNINSMLYATRGCQYSDQRDRVYAILNLCHHANRNGIILDYTISAQQVFQNTFSQVLENTNNLEMLSLCNKEDAYSTMPTWVDWSVSPKVLKIVMTRADVGTTALASCNSEGLLTVMGMKAASVYQVGLADQWPMSQGDSAEAIANLITRMLDSETVEASNASIESLCHVLTCGVLSDYLFPFHKGFPQLQESMQYLHECRSWAIGSSQAPPEPYHQFDWQARRLMQGRSLITTTGGHPGLAPKATRVGDIVCVMLGCTTPLVLRQKNHLQYELIGPCYLDGIMNGEALLGPLPKKWRLVKKNFPQYSASYWVFLDQDTGKTQITDPRLGPLPAGWRLESHAREDALNWWVNDDTGEFSGIFDPRLKFDALKARGVEFRNFELV